MTVLHPVHRVFTMAKKSKGRHNASKAKISKRLNASRRPLSKRIKVRVAARNRPSAATKVTVEAPKRSKKDTAPSVSTPEEIKEALAGLLNNEGTLMFLKKNVSKWAPDVLNMLTSPKTDEYLAEQLGMKINAIRRILNLMQGYGITNYYVSKNTNGWLSFAWYINAGKIQPFFEYINSVSNRKTVITDECNDYFICNACYPKDRLIFTFDAAFEAQFKCSGCGQKFAMLNRDGAADLMREVRAPESTDDAEI